MEINENTVNLLSTKFLLTVLVLILSYILVLVKMLEALEWFKWAVGLAGIYSTGNVLSKLVDSKSTS